jgi:hypothetical protein
MTVEPSHADIMNRLGSLQEDLAGLKAQAGIIQAIYQRDFDTTKYQISELTKEVVAARKDAKEALEKHEDRSKTDSHDLSTRLYTVELRVYIGVGIAIILGLLATVVGPIIASRLLIDTYKERVDPNGPGRSNLEKQGASPRALAPVVEAPRGGRPVSGGLPIRPPMTNQAGAAAFARETWPLGNGGQENATEGGSSYGF